ncbi:muramidase family protein [Glaciibacter superstes]|uniref:muramidase family protein n=1 Tax=Glaciibacter superstes TaxID=501023 RepID=UPI000417D406|nr:LysM peptidoglycan-binding domain-containing protein [Glaciibacter superstes]
MIGRGLLVSAPLVLVSVIAMTVNTTAPAGATTLSERGPQNRPMQPHLVLGDGALTSTTTALSSETTLAAEIAPSHYTVAEGDTVSQIAERFGLSTATVLAANGLNASALIFPGQVLALAADVPAPVPAPAPSPTPAPAPAPAGQTHIVASGDTISGIAATYRSSTDAVFSANGLDGSSVIFPGQTIVIPDAAAGTVPSAPAPAPEAPPATATHTIAAGDTISGIAAALGVSTTSLLDANGLIASSIIYPGQVLAIPGSAPVAVPVTPASVTQEITLMTDEMRQNAAIIVSVGRSASVSDFGLVVALAAAAQESGLRNVDYGDRDSLGLFQQRPSAGWGSPEQVMDPVRSSLAFFGGAGNPNAGVTRGLLDINGWESLTVTQAAQAVQISAFPDHYAKWEASARAWLLEL